MRAFKNQILLYMICHKVNEMANTNTDAVLHKRIQILILGIQFET